MLLKDFLNGGQKSIPHDQRTPLTCKDGTRVLLIENGSLLETKVTHAVVVVLELRGSPIPVAWRRIPNEEGTFYNISAQSLKRFVTAHGGEHVLLSTWYNTWKEIWTEYKTGRGQYYGLIVEPGKFQTEMLWAPFFWQVALEGSEDGHFYDEDDYLVSWFALDEWQNLFPPNLVEAMELEDLEFGGEMKYLFLRETNQGFVNTEIKAEGEIPVDGPMGDVL